jgi:peptidoglycan-associated lipoprotein
MKKHLLIGLATIAVVLGGCASKRPHTAASTGGATTTSDSGAGVSTAPLGGSDATAMSQGPGGEGILGPQGGLLAKRIVYFDYDRAEIRADQVELVMAHARYLASHATARVRLEGNTDERGTREYNIGLGERRAQAVRHSLLLQGVAESQVTTVSYGAERPAVAGSDESAWAQNRRVEIVYLSQ